MTEEKIKSRVFEYGNEKESEWPSKYGTREAGRFWWNHETQTFDTQPPPKPQKLGESAAVIPDEIEVKSMVDQKVYTSKRALLASYKRAGKEVVGNDVDYRPTKDPAIEKRAAEKLEADISRSYYQVRDGMAPLSEFDKARCKAINNQLRNYNYDRRDYGPDGKPRE